MSAQQSPERVAQVPDDDTLRALAAVTPMPEPTVKVGQLWESNDGKRCVRITHVDDAWDDAQYVNVATGRKGDIFLVNLHAKYNLIRPGAEGE